MAAEYLLLDATDFLLLDASGDRLLLASDAEVVLSDRGAPAKDNRYNRREMLRRQIKEEDDDLLRFVNEFLSRL